MASGKFQVEGIGEDIITTLPDDVLINIISRLDAEDAMKTSILSSRWKFLWTSIYNLRFSFKSEQSLGMNRRRRFCRPMSFGFGVMDFIDHVVYHCQSKTIQEFHLDTRSSYIEDREETWLGELLSSITERNVHTLTLNFCVKMEKHMFSLPQTIVTCKSLVKLTLGYWDPDIDVSNSELCFPSLKFLSFYVRCPDPDLLKNLFHSCPALEELIINGCLIRDDISLTFDITVPTLKKLTLSFNILCRNPQRIMLRARNLEYLLVSEYYKTYIVMEEETPFLDKLMLLNSSLPPASLNSSLESINRAKDLSGAISNTRCLVLSSYILEAEVISALIDNFPSFHKLVHLHLEINIWIYPLQLLRLLNNMPNLEVLIFEHDPYHGSLKQFKKKFTFEPLDWVPTCMLSLKKVYFFSLRPILLKLVRYLLRKAKVLERFYACVDEYGREGERAKPRIVDEIINVPRASSICEIEFVNPDYLIKLKQLYYLHQF